jgi:apolipoprotein N-acyltransferase
MTRFLAAFAAFGLLFLASPGVLSRSGSALIACAALCVWALVTSRPHRGSRGDSTWRAFWIDWAAAGLGFALLCVWGAYVWIGVLGFVAVAAGVYVAAAGVVLRALARRFPLTLAVPAAWVGCETLRFIAEPPFAFGWMRLGTYLHDVPFLAGGARVLGVGGLSFVIAAIGGGAADLIRERKLSKRTLVALVPVCVVAVLSLATSPPATVGGPRVLLVQPAFEQHRKMEAQRPQDLFFDSCRQTAQGLARGARAGEPPPDLVAWGETVFPIALAEHGLLDEYERGARSVAWSKYPVDPRDIESMNSAERAWVHGVLFGQNGSRAIERVLPEGTSFLSGVEYFAALGDDIRRMNAIVLWNAHGERAGVGGKVHLVPGAEHLVGLERAGWVRTLANEVAGYVPDLAAFDRTQVLTLTGRDGTSWKFGVTVCFDNAFDGPYTAPLRAGPLDFHLVCSNEAWYEKSFEYDQMVAFSRLLAIATGRSIVRATNGGVTIAIGPDGREIARLSVNGEDRMVAGALAVTVPVPSDRADAPVPIYVRAEWGVLGLWIAIPLVLLVVARRRSVTAPR